MFHSNIGKFICVVLVLCFSTECHAQYTKGGFFGSLQVQSNFCQIDGDGASGYNKFGFSVGYLIGQGLGNAKNGAWAYITGATFSVRGSRRPFDPENPGMQSFHFVYQMIDVPVMIARYYNKFDFGAGLRTTYLVKAEDKDGFVPQLEAQMRVINILGCAFVDYQLSDDVRAGVEAQYSLNSIRVSNNSQNLFFPTGVYHNVVSLGLKFQITGE